MMRNSLVRLFLVAALAAVTAACGVASGTGQVRGVAVAGGTSAAGLHVRLAAAQAEGAVRTSGNQVTRMANIFVSVRAVTAHAAGQGWVTVSETPVVVDLLDLSASAEALGFARLPSGRITQIRLYVQDDGLSHAITVDGDDRVLRIPSGLQSGVKLKGPFELGDCDALTVTGYVDLEKSILIHGRGQHDDWTLRPTVKRAEGRHDDAVCAGDELPPGGGDEPDETPETGEGEGEGVPVPESEGGTGETEPTDPNGETEPAPEGETAPDDETGDACAPVFDGTNLINPCTGEVLVQPE